MSRVRPYFETSNGKLYCGDAKRILRELEKDSVDVVVTSSPYWAKRWYGDEANTVWGGDENCDHEWVKLTTRNVHLLAECEHPEHFARSKKERPLPGLVCKKCGAWYGQLGLEPSPLMFIKHLVGIFDEVWRVLKPTGNLFVNIDDTWAGGGNWNGGGGRKYKEGEWERKAVISTGEPSPTSTFKGVKRSSLSLVPELFAIRMVYDRGWILREKIIWAKKVHFYKDRRTMGNAMPESVKNRFAHTWEFVFHFTKRQNYYFDWRAVAPYASILGRSTKEVNISNAEKIKKGDMLVRPPDVILINLRPFKDAHFAVFPPDIPEIFIKAGSPEGGVVLDPFAGAGTTLITAEKLGRKWIGIEINENYCEIIRKRFEKEGLL